MASDTEITKVRIVIRHLLWQIREVRNDRDAAWEWVNRFANTLQYQDLEQDPDQYALAILAEARSFNDLQQRKQQMRWVRAQLAKEGVTNPTQEQLDEKWLEMYGQENSPQDAPNGNAGVDMYDAGNGAASKSPTSCDQFTADGDIREDSQAKHDGSAITRNETRAYDALEPSASIYGDAATREGAEVVIGRESGAAVPTTVSSQFRGSAKNQGESNTSSTVPAVCPESGDISKARQGQARESRRTGGSSVRGMAKVAQPSVRSRASFRNKEDFIQWAIDDGLDPVDADECWEATEERSGKDADGNTVKNMKAFARQWCRTRDYNRRKNRRNA